MEYIMKSGALCSGLAGAPLARITSSLSGPQKTILLQGEAPALTADIRFTDDAQNRRGDVRCSRYVLVDAQGQICASAQPGYAAGEDPDVAGWPLCRLPRVDHAQAVVLGERYTLTMHNSQNYSLKDADGREALRVMHRGLVGGWTIEDARGFSPEILCGLFVFCRYIEQENEFMFV